VHIPQRFAVILKENGDTLYITRYDIQDMCIFSRIVVIRKTNGGTLYITRYNIQDMCIFPQRFVVMLKEKGNTLYRN